VKYLKDRCITALNLLQVVAPKDWRTDCATLHKLCCPHVRSKLDYGLSRLTVEHVLLCFIVYLLQMLMIILSVTATSVTELKVTSRSIDFVKNWILLLKFKCMFFTMVNARPDYCNAILHGTSKSNIQKLQRAQNSMACIVTGMRRSEHITPRSAPLA